jgi:aspartate/methionine/tyrosine aminotransferase
MDGLSELKTMRDINDYCVKRDIPSLAQGMIELPPTELLRGIVGSVAMKPTVHTYRNRFGEVDYRTGIKKLLQDDYNTTVTEDNILGVQGVSGGIVATLAWVKDRGGAKVGLVEPFYTYHTFQIQRIFGEDVPIHYVKSHDHSQNFAPNWDNIQKAIAEKVNILIVCNPGNPTARVWSKDELSRLVKLTKDAGITLLIDECYSDMVWKPAIHYSPIQDTLEPHVVVVRGFSKVLGCQSWRLGYVISAAETVTTLMRIADPIYICIPFLQHAMGEYLTSHFEDFRSHKAAVGNLICQNWELLSSAFQEAFGWIPIKPEGSMYGMFIHKSENDMEAVKLGLSKGVGVCPGSMFFANSPANTGYTRIHCGVSAEKAQRILENLKK